MSRAWAWAWAQGGPKILFMWEHPTTITAKGLPLLSSAAAAQGLPSSCCAHLSLGCLLSLCSYVCARP